MGVVGGNVAWGERRGAHRGQVVRIISLPE